jgi:hypothetical protein
VISGTGSCNPTTNFLHLLLLCLQMMGMQDPQSPAASFLDTRIPPFHKEFSTAGRWVAQCDPAHQEV